jgi:DNA uptake protein ComE-like DNA-binding protein
MADRIVAYRDLQDGLVAIEELSRIEGVGERLFATLAQYLEVR